MNVFNKDDLPENQSEQVPKPYQYYEQQLITHIHHFYISQLIEEPCYYSDMIRIIQQAGPTAVIYIHLNTPGGILVTGLQLINAIQASQAHTICSLEGEVSSLGTLIFLAGDEFVVHDFSLMMFHNYSGMVGGKEHEQMAALEATSSSMKNLMTKLCSLFLTEDELHRIKDGSDLYFHAPEIRERLENMVKKLEEQTEEKEAEDPPTKKKKKIS